MPEISHGRNRGGIMEELNKKLAEWRFPNAEITILRDKIWIVDAEMPDGADWCLLLTESLDAIFQWLVPKVKYCSLTKPEHRGFNGMWLGEVRSGVTSGHGEHKKPAPALCLAFGKLIDGEE